MNLVNRAKSFLGMEHRSADVGDAVLQAFQDSLLAGNPASVSPTATAACETAIRALSGPYGVATVTGPAMITPTFLMDLVRKLYSSGNAVYQIDLDRFGDLILKPASDFKVGGTNDWIYELDLPNPSGEPTRRRIGADGVVHVRINAPSSEPWRGRAPWQIASASAKTYASIERSLSYDASPRGGYILPQPDGSTATLQMKAALTAGLGAINLVDTTNQGFGQGITAAPKEDWVQKRFGALVPEPNIVLRDKSAEAILEAYGIPPAMFTGDGNSLREGRRILFYDSILPTSALITEELSRKLETSVSISHNDSEFSDSQRLGRYLKALVDAGYSLPDASAIVGLPRA